VKPLFGFESRVAMSMARRRALLATDFDATWQRS